MFQNKAERSELHFGLLWKSLCRPLKTAYRPKIDSWMTLSRPEWYLLRFSIFLRSIYIIMISSATIFSYKCRKLYCNLIQFQATIWLRSSHLTSLNLCRISHGPKPTRRKSCKGRLFLRQTSTKNVRTDLLLVALLSAWHAVKACLENGKEIKTCQIAFCLPLYLSLYICNI